MRVTGLGRGLSQNLARWRAPRAVHDPGKVIADLAAAVALGGDCLADIAVLREQPELAGPVASDPVVSRLVSALAAGPDAVTEGNPRRPGRSPGTGLGAGRRRRSRCRRHPGHRRPGRHHRDRALGQGPGLSHLEKDLRISPDDRLGRPRRRRQRGADSHRAASRERRLEHRRRPHRGHPAVAGAAAPAPAPAGAWSAPTPAAAPTGS